MMSSLRHLWNIPNPSEITKEETLKKCVGSSDMIISDSSKALIQTLEKNVLNLTWHPTTSKDLSVVGNGKILKDLLDRIKDSGFDPYEYHIPNAAAFTHDSLFYNQIIQSSIGRELQMVC